MAQQSGIVAAGTNYLVSLLSCRIVVANHRLFAWFREVGSLVLKPIMILVRMGSMDDTLEVPAGVDITVLNINFIACLLKPATETLLVVGHSYIHQMQASPTTAPFVDLKKKLLI